jgi:hypothetical protein
MHGTRGSRAGRRQVFKKEACRSGWARATIDAQSLY